MTYITHQNWIWNGSAWVQMPGDATNGIKVQVQGTVPVSGTFWQATQPVSGTVTANAGTGPWPVTDNAGSLTVDAPVGTPVFARLSDGAAALIGQKAMTASLPVTIASDQSAVPVSGTFWQATQPVSGTFWQATQPVSGTFWQATQPVSLASVPSHAVTQGTTPWLVGGNTAAGATDADNPIKIGGVYNASPTVRTTGQRTDLATDSKGAVKTVIQAIGSDTSVDIMNGAADAALGSKNALATWNYLYGFNATDGGWDRLRVVKVPATASGVTRPLAVDINSYQLLSYDVSARNIVSGALVANTAKAIFSMEHALASTKTVKIRRIMVHFFQTSALSGSIEIQLMSGTAASSAGTAVTPTARKPTDAAAEVTVKTLPTIVAATVRDIIPAGGFASTTALYSPPVVVYDWQEGSSVKPLELTAGALQSLVINVISTAAHNLTMTVSVDFTEE
jgi:hypothetical protein